jgi:hypothetical protein
VVTTNTAISESAEPKTTPHTIGADAETISNKRDAAGDTLKELKVATVSSFTLTKDNYLKTVEELKKLRDDLKNSKLDKNLVCQFNIKSDSLGLALNISGLVKEIHEALKTYPSANVILTHPKEIKLTAENSLHNIIELNSVLEALRNPLTPKSLKPQIIVKSDSAEAVGEAAKIMHQIRKELLKRPGSTFTLKAEGSVSALETKKMLENYRTEAGYDGNTYNIKVNNIQEDLKNIHKMLDKASREPDKIIKINLPTEPGISRKDLELLKTYFDHFTKHYPNSFLLSYKGGDFNSLENPYRTYFVYISNKIEIGNTRISRDEEKRISEKLALISEELTNRATGFHQGNNKQWMVKVSKGASISPVLVKKINELRDLHDKLQEDYPSYRADNFIFESERLMISPPSVTDFAKEVKDAAVTTGNVIRNVAQTFFGFLKRAKKIS